MKLCLKFLWRWSLLITVPVTIVLFYWGEEAIARYYTFGVRYNSAPAKMSLADAGKLEASYMLRKFKLSFMQKAQKSDKRSLLRTINIFVPESGLAQLDSNLPHSGFTYVQGLLLNDQKLQKVKVRYRGDYLPHWGFFKKSLRIKTKKKSLFEGMRAFNVIAPKGAFQLHNYLGYRLANYFELIAPHSEMVNLNMNGESQGVHILVEQLEELTLRNHDRMPGDLYVGELVGKDSYSNVNSKVFEHPGLWKKVAVNNHYPEDSKKPLEHLIQLINEPSSDLVQRQLSNILDMSAWGKFSAFETLGQTFHFDHAHNWRLYFDPMRGKFEPIVWDPIPWVWPWTVKGQKPYLDLIRTTLHKALFKNGDFLRARHEALASFFRKGLDKKFLQEVDEIVEAVKPAIKVDPNLNYSQDRIEKQMETVRGFIGDIFNDMRRLYYEGNGTVTYATTSQGIDLSIAGRRTVKRTSIRYLSALHGDISATIQYLVDGVVNEEDVSGVLSINGSHIDLDVPLMARMQFVAGTTDIKNRLEFSPSYYKLILNGIPSDNRLLEVFVNRRETELERATPVEQVKKVSFSDLSHILYPFPATDAMVWQGDVKIEGTMIIENELIILPGTKILMGSGASLILKNRLIAEGNVENPIIFVPEFEGQSPWGAVVLEGAEANESRLKNCEFSGGSGLKGDLFEYTAMFSIHDVKRVEVTDCIFQDSQITDDMVHTVYSEVKFTDCTFEKSLFDGLDIDISEVVIERCRFKDSGNDAIDLMNSKAVIIDTLVQGSGDKAVSVGEGSKLLAVNNVFQTNMIAVQAKDGSTASLYNVDILDNTHALDAYKKNWRYGSGGQIFFHKGRLLNNEKMVTADKKSTVKVFDSYIDKPVKTTKKRIKVYHTGMVHKDKTQSKKLKQNHEEKVMLEEINSEYLDRINPDRRGASQIVYH